jgi:hypothetical protein
VAARIDAADLALARRALPARAFTLWESMPVADRRHGLDVANRLLGLGVEDDDLIAAALLHDAAKGHRMRLWHRAAGVVLEAVSRRWLVRLASSRVGSWRYPFHLYLHHAAMSADAALAAGCPPRVAGFIRGRLERETDAHLLAHLRAADEAS